MHVELAVKTLLLLRSEDPIRLDDHRTLHSGRVGVGMLYMFVLVVLVGVLVDVLLLDGRHGGVGKDLGKSAELRAGIDFAERAERAAAWSLMRPRSR